MKKSFVVSLLLSSALFFGCSPSVVHETSDYLIKPPVENVDIPYDHFKVKGKTGGFIVLKNGGTITIPPNALVDKHGNVVEDAEIHYREFHNALEILLSGISMQYDSGGVVHSFQTAGMFDLRGFSNGEEIFVAEGSEIAVNMGSNVNDQTYNFYAYDEEMGWNYLTTAEAQPDLLRDEVEGILNSTREIEPPVKPILPRVLDKGKPVLNFQLSYLRFPELAPYRHLVWQYAGNDATSDPENYPWIYEESWQHISLEAASGRYGNYHLHLSAPGKRFSTLIRPVVSERNYEKAQAMFAKLQEEYEKAMELKQREMEMATARAQFFRASNIGSFGVFNWDIIFNVGSPVIVQQPRFNYPRMEANPLPSQLFLICGDNRVVMPFKTNEPIHLVPGERNQIVVLFGGNKVGVFDNQEEVNKLLQRASSTNSVREHSFTLDIRTVNSVEDFITSGI